MTTPDRLDQAERHKLARICGRLSSDFDGERAVAARIASEFIRARGLTWDALIAGAPQLEDAGDDWREIARRCNANPHALTEWERRFVRDVVGFVEISAKQRALLMRLAAKVAGNV